MKTPYLDSQLKGYRQLAESGKMPESGMEQLRELEAIKEGLSIHSVSRQRELLIDFMKSLNGMDKHLINKGEFKNVANRFLSINCG